jgi:O-antigen ligase
VKIIAEAGILGFVAFMATLYVILRQEWRITKTSISNDLMRGVVYGLVPATFACLVLFNLSSDHFILHRFMGNFWMILALVHNYCYGSEALQHA